MLSELGIVKSVWSRWPALVVTAGFVACVEDSVAPAAEPADDTRRELRVLGLAELTFSGIGTPEFSSSLIVAPTMEALEALRAQRNRSGHLRDLVTEDLTIPDNSGGTGNGTIQLTQPQKNRFEQNGVRYLSTSFSVRNAQSDGTAYDTPRSNLTFIAVGTGSTINGTALSKLELAGGASAPDSLALQVLPTVRVESGGDSLIVPDPDVLQILREAELTQLTGLPSAVTTVFPYGFVVRRTGDNTTRQLPASPGPNDFAGVIDFAFSIPMQDTPADDPETLSVLLLAVDNTETQLAQGLQQQGDSADIANLRQRATALGADTVTLLPGGTLPAFSGGLRTLCSVRTAGAPGSATAYLVNIAGFQSFSPTPNTVIPDTAAFEATFTTAVFGIGPTNFTVRGSQSGPAFRDTIYSGNGTNAITTPRGDFSAGEEVEIALSTPCPQPHVASYRVQGGGNGNFSPDTSYAAGGDPRSVAIGDLDGINGLDLAVANGTDGVSVLLNSGSGTFSLDSTYTALVNTANSVAIGDLDGNGSLDLAVGGGPTSAAAVSVFLNSGDGTGTFVRDSTYSSGDTWATSVAIGDLDGNGSLDLAVAAGDNFFSEVFVLLNDGNGKFQPQPAHGVGGVATSVAIGDLDGNGSLDLAVGANFSSNVTVFLNNGSGTFQSGQTFPAGQRTVGVAIADLDGNSTLDLAVTTFTTDSVSVLSNDGTANFSSPQLFFAGDSPTSIAIGDLDGNGSLDLAVGNDESPEISVLLNSGSSNGTFQFQPRQPHSVAEWATSVATGDLDGNGSLDLAVSNLINVSVLLGAVP